MMIPVIMLWFIGFIMILITHETPILHYFYFDVLGGFICGIAIIVAMYRLMAGGGLQYFKMPRKNTPLFEFLYRIGEKRTIYGKRIPGTGFSQIKGHGLVQEIGRLPSPGSVYRHGDKSVQFVLQDVGHTPNPKFAGFLSWLNEIGFDNIHDVKRVLNGYDPHLMARIWKNLNSRDNNGGIMDSADLLVSRLQNIEEKDMKHYPDFKDSKYNKNIVDDMHRSIDKIIGGKK